MTKVNSITGTVNENGTVNVNKAEVLKVKATACEKYGVQPFEHIVVIGSQAVKFVWDTRKVTGTVDVKAIAPEDFVKQVRDKGEAIDVTGLEGDSAAKLQTETAKITADAKVAAEKLAAELKAEADAKAEKAAKANAEKDAKANAEKDAKAKAEKENRANAAPAAEGESTTANA